MKANQIHNTRTPFQAALSMPLNLAMLGMGILAGLLSAWWLAPAGLLLWVIMVAVAATDPSLRFRLRMEHRAPLAQRFQERYNRIQRTEAAFYNNLSNAGRKVWHRFQPVMEIVHNIANHSHALSLRMSAMENHRLVTASNRDFKAELRMLDVQIETAADEQVRREYLEQKQELQIRIESIKDLETVLNRVESEMRSLATGLETALTRVIHLQSLGVNEIEQEFPALIAILESLASGLKQVDLDARSFTASL